jgi:hypothetical protein
MLGKIGVLALATLPVFGATHTADMRELYNEMYPVNAMTRDAFNLCHESDATFVRALHFDRERCLDHMPHAIALAIGRIPPDSQLATLPATIDTARDLAELAAPLLAPREMPRHLAAFVDVRHVATSGAGPEFSVLALLDGTAQALDDSARARVVGWRSDAGTTELAPLPLLAVPAVPAPEAAPAGGRPAGA